MVGARAREIYDKRAKERQKRKPANSVPESLPEQKKTDARDEIGRVVGVSGQKEINKIRAITFPSWSHLNFLYGRT